MNDDAGLLPAEQDDLFEIALRGYNRRQVDEFADQARRYTSSLEERLSVALGEVDRLQGELDAARRAPASRPVHEEVSDRIAQILKLAEEEASAQKTHTAQEITQLRWDAQEEANTLRAEAKGQAEETLASARDQASRIIASAQAEAGKTTSTARAEAEQMTGEARQQADTTAAEASAQAQRLVEEAAARAAAIHDGAEGRFGQLRDSHAKVMDRLTEIRDVVTDLVAGDTARGSLADEVARRRTRRLAGAPPT